MVGKFSNNSNVCHRSVVHTCTRILCSYYNRGCHDTTAARPPSHESQSPGGWSPGLSISRFRLPWDPDVQPRMGTATQNLPSKPWTERGLQGLPEGRKGRKRVPLGGAHSQEGTEE